MPDVGATLHKRYKIDSQLGQGGMGGVFLATDATARKRVAIKEVVLPGDPAQYRLGVQQFTKEAEILRQLHHPHIPAVLDFFEESGKMYLVMDYVSGQTYEKVCEFTPLDEPRLLALARDLCDVLDYLHTHEPPIIFRDLKPSNIMATPEGITKLIDFGIAKALDQATGGGTHTSVRGAGTPGFAAPEQYGTGTDARTDIYALGVTLYSLLTRTIPPSSLDIASGGAEVIPLASLRPDVSQGTVRAIESMMKVNRRERPASVKDVIKAFGFTAPTPPPPPAPLPARRPMLPLLLAVAMVVVMGVLWAFRHRDNPAVGDGRVVAGERLGTVSLTEDPVAVEARLHMDADGTTSDGMPRFANKSDGLSVILLADGSRIQRIMCYGEGPLKTDQGLGLGSASAHEAIVKAYGKPRKVTNPKPGQDHFEYRELGLGLTVDNASDKIVGLGVFHPRR